MLFLKFEISVSESFRWPRYLRFCNLAGSIVKSASTSQISFEDIIAKLMLYYDNIIAYTICIKLILHCDNTIHNMHKEGESLPFMSYPL